MAEQKIRPLALPTAEEALPGRADPVETDDVHALLRRPLRGPPPKGYEVATFAMGCFWGVERLFYNTPGVWVTAAGYTGGHTPNPLYEEVRSQRTGHAEAVRIVYSPKLIRYAELLKLFWENHDPAHGMRQGNDIGNQYRSAIYYHSAAQQRAAEQSRAEFAETLRKGGWDPVTTAVLPAEEFYFAESRHQAYLFKNPQGYCGLCKTGFVCVIEHLPAGDSLVE